MELLFPRIARLDIGKATCVRTPGSNGRRVIGVRTYRTMTRPLWAGRDWLAEPRVDDRGDGVDLQVLEGGKAGGGNDRLASQRRADQGDAGA